MVGFHVGGEVLALLPLKMTPKINRLWICRYASIALFLLIFLSHNAVVFADDQALLVDIMVSWKDAKNKKNEKTDAKAIQEIMGIVEREASKGIDINLSDKDGNTPLVTAVWWTAWHYDGEEFYKLVDLLLAKGAKPSTTLQEQDIWMFAATADPPNTELLDILCKAGYLKNGQIELRGKKLSVLELARMEHPHFPEIEAAFTKCVASQK